MMQLKKLNWHAYPACALAGALCVLAFVPSTNFGLPAAILAIIALVILLLYWQQASKKQAFWQGLSFGIGLFGLGVSWVYVSIHTYGNVNWLLAGLITGGFVLMLSLFPALSGYLLARFSRLKHFSGVCCVFPFVWTLGELLRSHLFTGFPWLLLGDSQVSNPGLSAYARICGDYGVSFLAALSAGLISQAILRRQQRLISLTIVILLWLGGYGLGQVHWTTLAAKQPLTVSLVQGNIPLSMKWDPQSANNIANTYADLTMQNWRNIVIWPENGLPIFKEQAQPFLDALGNIARQHHSAILTGLPIYKPNPDRYYNGALVFGAGSGEYLKHHLVPFGEYVPLSHYFGRLLQFLQIPMSDFSAGPYRQSLVQMLNFPVAVFICYEIAYPDQIRNNSHDAAFIATLSDDSWFGHSLGALQQEQMAKMRALETGRYVLSASNDGMTAIIDPEGAIIAEAPRYTQAVVTGTIYPAMGETPWVKYGYWPLAVLMLLSLLIWVVAKRQD